MAGIFVLIAICHLVAGSLQAIDSTPGFSVVHGNANLSNSGGIRVITQTTDQAIINWSSFSVDAGTTTRFDQPGVNSVALNRVTGGTPSTIAGSLLANGRIFLINPNGILITSTGVVDVGGFTASTLDITNEEFLAGGDLNFLGDSQATIVNMGTIGASEGDVFLIAAQVSNAGQITASRGTVGLAAGNDVLLKESGSERVFVRSASGSTKADGVVNTGTINAKVAELKAHGGNIYAMAVRNEGSVRATAVSREGGQIFLRAGGVPKGRPRISSTGTLRAEDSDSVRKIADDLDSAPGGDGGSITIDTGESGTTEVGGTVSVASSGGEGGDIFIFGETITVFDDSVIIANGEEGGRIFVGSAHTTDGVDFTTAENITVGTNALFDVSAGEVGNAGEAILFANQDLTFNGYVIATGGTTSGDGGFVELSGKETLQIPTLVDAVDISAASGEAGTLFLDPTDILISSATGGLISGPTTMQSNLNATDVSNFLQNSGSLTIQTDSAASGAPGETGNITLQTFNSITWSSSNSLSFQADNRFIMEEGSDIRATGGGNLSVVAGNGIQIGIDGGLAAGYTTEISTTSGSIAFETQNTPGARGVEIRSANIRSGSGDISVKGYNAVGIGTLFSESTVRSSSGDITLEGYATGMGNHEGLRFENASASSSSIGPVSIFTAIPSLPNGDVETGSNATIKLIGLGSGTGSAVHFFDDAATTSASLFMVGGDGTQDLEVQTLGGDVELSRMEAEEFLFSKAAGASGGLKFDGAVLDWVTVNSADSVDIESPGALRVRSINSDGNVALHSASGTFTNLGTIASGTDIKIKGSDSSFGTLELFGTLSAPVITIDGGTARADVETQGSFNLSGVSFLNIDEVRGVSAGGIDSLIDSNANSVIEIFEDPLASSGSRTGALIRGTQFYGYENISGGGGNDTFNVGTSGSFADTQTTLLGGAGNDLFAFFNQATVAGVSGEGGFDTLQIDDRLLGGTNTYNISEGLVSRNPQYIFNGIDGLQLFLGAGNDTVNTDTYSFAQRLDGGAGFDTLNVGSRAFLPISPALLNGQVFLHSNFEAPVTAAPTSGEPLISTVVANAPLPGGGSGLDFNSTNTFSSGPTGTANVTPAGGGAFPAAAAPAIVGQAVVLQINGDEYLLRAPMSLDGTFSFAPIESIRILRENLNPQAWQELAASIEYDGPMVLVMSDGPVAVDLDGTPPADVVNELQNNLLAVAAQELAAALELFVGLPVTDLDGAVSISVVPVVPEAAVTQALLENIDDAALSDLAAALDGP